MPKLLSKTITPKKKSFWRKPLNALLLFIAIPVIAIAILSLIVYYVFLWLLSLFVRPKTSRSRSETYHLELELLNNEYVRLSLVEDENDLELARLNEQWADEVYAEETSLFRVQSTPLIPELEGKICCYFRKDLKGGSLLQVLTTRTARGLGTTLVFLNYENLSVERFDDTGAFHLYNDDNFAMRIEGFNTSANLRMEIADY